MSLAGIADIDQLYTRLIAGDRVALAQSITLVESTRERDRGRALALLDRCTAEEHASFRFAVSGSPGAGKSTLIESLGTLIVAGGHKLAVLAIDPTSPVSRGAILGDKTRMEQLARHPDVFIRPSAAGTTLGGVADRTREVIALCESAGYDRICVETVGVGQSETEVHRMTDFFLLLVLPGGGDDLQGIKKGIVELADLIAVTKTDGIHREAAKETQRFYAQAVHYFAPKEHGIATRVMTCSALERNGMQKINEALQSFASATQTSGYQAKNRARQNADWFDARVHQLMQQTMARLPAVKEALGSLRREVAAHAVSVSSALRQLEQIMITSIGER